jgi:hypothetical protein
LSRARMGRSSNADDEDDVLLRELQVLATLIRARVSRRRSPAAPSASPSTCASRSCSTPPAAKAVRSSGGRHNTASTTSCSSCSRGCRTSTTTPSASRRPVHHAPLASTPSSYRSSTVLHAMYRSVYVWNGWLCTARCV